MMISTPACSRWPKANLYWSTVSGPIMGAMVVVGSGGACTTSTCSDVRGFGVVVIVLVVGVVVKVVLVTVKVVEIFSGSLDKPLPTSWRPPSPSTTNFVEDPVAVVEVAVVVSNITRPASLELVRGRMGLVLDGLCRSGQMKLSAAKAPRSSLSSITKFRSQSNSKKALSASLSVLKTSREFSTQQEMLARTMPYSSVHAAKTSVGSRPSIWYLISSIVRKPRPGAGFITNTSKTTMLTRMTNTPTSVMNVPKKTSLRWSNSSQSGTSEKAANSRRPARLVDCSMLLVGSDRSAHDAAAAIAAPSRARARQFARAQFELLLPQCCASWQQPAASRA
mmetsp:Transcript_20149/g.51116  ORF Transcript_20149/g.51116 Transcript_20149/m.51116 type:complete len:336 (-) Transcript_20149:2-1009(-)